MDREKKYIRVDSYTRVRNGQREIVHSHVRGLPGKALLKRDTDVEKLDNTVNWKSDDAEVRRDVVYKATDVSKGEQDRCAQAFNVLHYLSQETDDSSKETAIKKDMEHFKERYAEVGLRIRGEIK